MTDEVTTVTTPDTSTVAADAKPAEVKPELPKRDRAQERIDELTWKTRDLERQLTEAKKPPEKPLKEPTLEEFQHDEDAHKKALREYEREVIRKEAREEALNTLKAEREAEKEATRRKSFQEKFDSLPAERRAVAESAIVPENKEYLAMILESDSSTDILEYLGEHREIAEKMIQLPKEAYAREIGRIEARIELSKEKPAVDTAATPPEPKVSKAPPPVSKLEATDSSTSVKPDDPASDKAMSDAEWLRARNKQASKRR